jgi:hypothetical protein
MAWTGESCRHRVGQRRVRDCTVTVQKWTCAMQENQAMKPARRWLLSRALNILLRTSHIGVAGVLFGGHVFAIQPEQLRIWVYMAILTGAVLTFMEAYPSWRYVCEARGAMVLLKLLLLCSIPWLWQIRVPILAAVVVIGSVGSHMPRRHRHYVILGRRTVDEMDYPRRP